MGSNEDSMDVDPGPSDAVQTFSVTSKQYCDILVILFCGTVGTNEPRLLGSDESDVIIIAWQLVDISLNTVTVCYNKNSLSKVLFFSVHKNSYMLKVLF